ncbi:glycosyltransferase family 4 protein [Candidatus Microgenomates bacterium]|nr:glycosyltransferase family 4 protein [Candidatus Microgenomates bacterium]
MREKYQLPEEFVLYVGDVTWNKNLPRLVAAIKQLDIPLVMVGNALVQKEYDVTNSWNADLTVVQKATAGDKRFIKLGFVPTDDVVSLYNSATVCAFPSIYEGFGLPVLEAMQCGCPVVTTEGGSLPEVAESAAFYVDEYSVESIEKGIGKVFSDKQLQKTLSSKGLIQAKKFSWKKTAAETLAAYKQAIS